MLETGVPRAVTLGDRWRLRMARGRLWLEPPLPAEPYSLDLAPDARVSLPWLGWQVRVRHGAQSDSDADWHALMSSDARLEVRSATKGDRIVGPDGSAKVSKLFSKHLPRHLRQAWPVFCENDRIVWIPGIWKGSVTGNLLVEVTAHG
jgi:tRNA(Ile)-lysidine synthetase-like protein